MCLPSAKLEGALQAAAQAGDDCALICAASTEPVTHSAAPASSCRSLSAAQGDVFKGEQPSWVGLWDLESFPLFSVLHDTLDQ